MIDLIIPYYNNPTGLQRTLESINYDVFCPTIIDDCSQIAPGAPATRLEKNVGPGMARQYGIEHTSNPYLMFLDAGDVFISKEVQQEVAAEATPNLTVWPYLYKGALTDAADNRMHGKLYSRAFLDKYWITFSAAGSYMDEDVGFNRTCRIILRELGEPWVLKKTPLIEWVREEDSITQKDGGVAIYRDQTRSLALNAIHTIDILRQNGFEQGAISEMHSIAALLYYWFLFTLVRNPTYADQAWQGARIFYKQYESELHLMNQYIYPEMMKQLLTWRAERRFNCSINVARFAADIQLHAHPPLYYTKGDTYGEDSISVQV